MQSAAREGTRGGRPDLPLIRKTTFEELRKHIHAAAKERASHSVGARLDHFNAANSVLMEIESGNRINIVLQGQQPPTQQRTTTTTTVAFILGASAFLD